MDKTVPSKSNVLHQEPLMCLSREEDIPVALQQLDQYVPAIVKLSISQIHPP